MQERAEDVQEQAEDMGNSSSPAQEQAAAEVQETVTEAAPEEDLGDTLSVLQGAESAMDEPESSQVNCVHSLHFLLLLSRWQCQASSGRRRVQLRVCSWFVSQIPACSISCMCPDRRDSACIVAYIS